MNSEVVQSNWSVKCGSRWPTFEWTLTYHPRCIYVQIYMICNLKLLRYELGRWTRSKSMKHEMWVKVSYFCLDADLPSHMHLCTSLQDPTIRNCDSEEAKSKSFLHFAFQSFQVFGSRLLPSFFCIFASRRVAEWSRRWTLKPRCRHRCGFDPHVCQGFKAPSLAQGFADFPAWNIGFLPPQDWWPCENPISVKQSFILRRKTCL
jgi:hypothetical protein